MAHAGHEKDRKKLETEIEGREYAALLRDLQAGAREFPRHFSSWRDVLAFMRGGTSDDPRKDEILVPIFEAHRSDQDPRWRAILLAIFWPGLDSIHRKKGGWDNDGDELWQNVLWVFLRVVCKVDPVKRPRRLVQKVINDTLHDLYEEYSERWDHPETPTDPDDLSLLAGGHDDIDYERIDLRLAQEAEMERLRLLLTSGLIEEDGFLLIVGTRVYGKSMADYAREMGLDYELARKRRLRAESVLRRHGGHGPWDLSRSQGVYPPLPSGGRQAQGGESA